MKILINEQQLEFLVNKLQKLTKINEGLFDDEQTDEEKFLDSLDDLSDNNKEYHKLKRPIPYDKDIEILQTALQFLKYSLPVWGIDGKFGPETEEAVKSFQSDNGLKDTGILKSKDITKLKDELISKDFENDGLKKIQKNQTQFLDDYELTDPTVISNPKINIDKLPSNLTYRFKQLVDDKTYDKFINDVKSIGMDPLTAIRQLYVESMFDTDVINCKKTSSAGAMGIAQIMPQTWNSYSTGGSPCNIKDTLLVYPKIMKDLINKFPGRIDLAIAGYNSGPNKEIYKKAMDEKIAFEGLPIGGGGVPLQTYKYTSTILQPIS